MGKLKFGVFLPFYAFRGNPKSPALIFRQIRAIASECESLGFDSVWLDDHLMYGETPILECWTMLSALAASTTKIRLGTMVTSNAFRNPAVLAKMASTVDVISGGRLEFGLGAGVHEAEHTAYGLPFPKPSARVERLAESVEIIRRLWTQEKVTYVGKHYQVAEATCEPKPIQQPYPPIVIGGSGEKHLLKVTALYADRFDFGYQSSIELYRNKLRVLQNLCGLVGRDFGEIERSCWPAGQILIDPNPQTLEEKVLRFKPKEQNRDAFVKENFVGPPGDLSAMLRPYLDLGVTYFMLLFMDLPGLGGLRHFAAAVNE